MTDGGWCGSISSSPNEEIDRVDDTKLEFAAGAIVEILPDLRCSIRLDDARVVTAIVPRFTARKMFRIVPGDRCARVGVKKATPSW